MPRAVKPWFRFYTEAFGDRKMRRLTPAQRWVWVAILGAARESPEPGRLLIAEGVPMTAVELADYADVPRRSIRPAIDAMRALNMLEIGTGGVLTVTNWATRQYESDTSTPRTRRHRSQVDNPEIPGLEQVVGTPVGTPSARSHDRSNVVPGNGIGTDQRQRTETETDLVANSRGEPHLPAPAPDTTAPHPGTCQRHPNGNPTDEPCAGCARARQHHEQLDRERTEQARAAQLEQKRTERATRAQAIHDCDLCDTHGYRHTNTGTTGGPCNHQPLNPGGLARARQKLQEQQ